MAAAGAELLFHIRENVFYGFLLRLLNICHLSSVCIVRRCSLLMNLHPDVVVLIDYPVLTYAWAKALGRRDIQ
jgi:lipid A disaccharide synthetase